VNESGFSAESSTGPLDIQQIMAMIMHRPPFLLVDRVVECVPGHYIHGYKNISRADGLLRVQRNERPTLPRLLIIEALAQLSVILTYKSLDLQPSGQELMFFAGIDDATFEGDARAGDVLGLHSEVRRLRTKIGWFRARADVGGVRVAEMTMLASIQLG
jgi:3-hydroxyacyl-[acyl-carrier-protein] dehydratase